VIAVFAFIRKGGGLLLVRPSDGQQYWSLPGGKVEPGEGLDQAAIREVKEETRLDVRLVRMVGVYSKIEESALAVTFEAQPIDRAAAPIPGHEISECAYFAPDHLPYVRKHLHQRVADLLDRHPHPIFRAQ
jgi:8-oxo-dGTP diphosphatase